MDDIIKSARELGRKIGVHPRTQAFTDAAKAIATDREAQKLMHDYQEKSEKIRAREEMRQPIEVSDKRALADLEMQVAGNDKLKVLMSTQADYVQLMQQVQAAIDEASQE